MRVTWHIESPLEGEATICGRVEARHVLPASYLEQEAIDRLIRDRYGGRRPSSKPPPVHYSGHSGPICHECDLGGYASARREVGHEVAR